MKELLVILILCLLPFATALEFDEELSDEDQQAFDQILEPILKVYNFIKYAATALAVVLLVFAGVSFILSGGNQGKREQAKMMAMYIIIGLIVIWAAPLIVEFIVG